MKDEDHADDFSNNSGDLLLNHRFMAPSPYEEL